jgi:hypothetical protein
VFESRATEAEYLDRPDCDPTLAAASYRFMTLVNARLGGLRVVRRYLASETAARKTGAPFRLLDIGSGSCDIPLALSRWARASGIPLRITCLELSGQAVAIARKALDRAADPAVDLLQEDVFVHQPPEPYDGAVASMCFHHFSDARILELLGRLRAMVRASVLINDLRRSRLAWAGAALLLGVIGAPAGVRHDALLSIRRGFTVGELTALLERLDDVSVSVEPAFGFRIAARVRFKSGAHA